MALLALEMVDNLLDESLQRSVVGRALADRIDQIEETFFFFEKFWIFLEELTDLKAFVFPHPKRKVYLIRIKTLVLLIHLGNPGGEGLVPGVGGGNREFTHDCFGDLYKEDLYNVDLYNVLSSTTWVFGIHGFWEFMGFWKLARSQSIAEVHNCQGWVHNCLQGWDSAFPRVLFPI